MVMSIVMIMTMSIVMSMPTITLTIMTIAVRQTMLTKMTPIMLMGKKKQRQQEIWLLILTFGMMRKTALPW
jgi:hypothetical protein